MEHCPVCRCEVESPGWCDDCVRKTLEEQAREDTPRVRPQVFRT